MNDVLSIKVTRDGKERTLPLELCTKTELIKYFDALAPEDAKEWNILLLGMAFNYSLRIEELERALASFRGAL
jgi:hypothetical protein